MVYLDEGAHGGDARRDGFGEEPFSSFEEVGEGELLFRFGCRGERFLEGSG